MGWAPTNKIFIHKPTPKSNFCLLAPAQFSKHLEGWTLRTPGGWAHHKLNFTIQTHPEEQLLFAGPCPILYPSRFFRPGHYSGYPRGSTFGIAPWLGAEPRWNEEPMPNFGVMACVGPAAGRRTYTHTYIHTHFHLYIGDSVSSLTTIQFQVDQVVIQNVWNLIGRCKSKTLPSQVSNRYHMKGQKNWTHFLH